MSTHAPQEMFSPTLIPQSVSDALPKGYTMRPLRSSDYNSGFLDILRDLTSVGEVSSTAFDTRYQEMVAHGGYYILVITDESGRTVGTGALVAEKKLFDDDIHGLGSVGHIEDIVVAKDQQGKKLGLRLLDALTHLGKEIGCYKCILDCSEVNEGFYIKCGYQRKGLQMARYYE